MSGRLALDVSIVAKIQNSIIKFLSLLIIFNQNMIPTLHCGIQVHGMVYVYIKDTGKEEISFYMML